MERGVLVAVLVVLVLAAGCFGAAKEPAKPAAANATTHAPNATMPDGREGAIVAFAETNATESGAGGVEHRHDYWQGRERVTLGEGVVTLGAAATNASGAAASLPLDGKALVYEGAGAVEVTLSDPQRRACVPVTLNGVGACTDTAAPAPADPAGGPSGVKLQLRTASSAAWLDTGEVTWGAPLRFAVKDPKMTDMPHATRTLWAFRVVSDDPAQRTLQFHAKIEAVRAGGVIALWPGHPDFYPNGTHNRTLVKASVATKESGLESLAPGATDTSMTEVVPPKLISYGTKAVRVEVLHPQGKTTNPADGITAWQLVAHNASGRWLSTPARAAGNASYTWTLPVDDDGMDSPYADASRWGFALRAWTGNDHVTLSGFTAYDATYDIVVTATDLKPDAFDKLG